MKQNRLIGKGSVNCPLCLNSSGILADGKGTICTICGGNGTIGKTKYNKFIQDYEL